MVFLSEHTRLNFSTVFCQARNASAFARTELAWMQGLGLPVSLLSWLAFCTYNNSNDKKPQKNPLQNVALPADRVVADIQLFVRFLCWFGVLG